MVGEAVQVINKLPALRFLFFLLVHGTTPGIFGISLLKAADIEILPWSVMTRQGL